VKEKRDTFIIVVVIIITWQMLSAHGQMVAQHWPDCEPAVEAK